MLNVVIDTLPGPAHNRAGVRTVFHNLVVLGRDGGVIFSYYPDEAWLKESRFLNCAPADPELLTAGRL